MNTSQEILESLKESIGEFIDQLNEILPDNAGDDLLLVSIFFNRAHVDRILKHVRDHIMPYEEMIEKRKLNFFQENKDNIFKGLDQDKVNKYADMFTDGTISKSYLKGIWEHFDTIVALYNLYMLKTLNVDAYVTGFTYKDEKVHYTHGEIRYGTCTLDEDFSSIVDDKYKDIFKGMKKVIIRYDFHDTEKHIFIDTKTKKVLCKTSLF